MRWLPVLILALAPVAAHAITQPSHGLYVGAAGGVAAELGPARAGPGWQVGAGWWWGRYDEVYALGQFTSVGVTLRQSFLDGGLRSTPQLEVRRGSDVLVVGYHAFLGVGPEIRPDGAGVSALLGGGAKWRFTPHWGIGVRAGAGAAWHEQTIQPRLAARLHLEWTGPLGRRSGD